MLRFPPDTVEVPTPVEQTALIHHLRRQLHAVQQEHERYRNHYREVESVCWDLVGDMKRLRQEGLDSSQVHAALPATGRHTRGPSPHSRATWEETKDSSAQLGSPPSPIQLQSSTNQLGQEASTPRQRQPQPVWSRAHGALHLEREEAQALMDRLWTLRQWMGDLFESVQALTSPAAARENSSSELTHRASACLGEVAEVNAKAGVPRASHPVPQAGCVSARQLHRILDEIYLQFTQLQATLTDTLWTTAHPPALSTPAHTRKDRSTEVERLRAINQQLRRTLRDYEQARSRRTTTASSATSTFSRPPLRKFAAAAALRAPPGYAASQEANLFVALPRRW
ncbi:hypothetical protein ABL78_7469 [Leptomonas seymouri]|uniref:Uncharacterized protein n=1 Tax=Leptomonas seymouri TaxID=5684 RepID=A0A0N1IH48_LEPSE|nr:hypothetical protein ABL78_7469 [Leptomonas seymouri]|eukprot:KPI83495.1 hypothetical protein ABL78_7469 [Leptomonas seymouri]